MDVVVIVIVLIAVLVLLLPMKGGFGKQMSPKLVWFLILIALVALVYFLNR